MNCVAPSCRNSHRKDPNSTFFCFPRDKERCLVWIINSGREDYSHQYRSNIFNPMHHRLCADHFEDSQFANSYFKNRLLPNAIPTLFHVGTPQKQNRNMKTPLDGSKYMPLVWKEHHSTFLDSIMNLNNKEIFSDMSLFCEGQIYQAHRFVLSTCSDYFRDLLSKVKDKNPVILINDLKKTHLEALLAYMYSGKTSILQSELASVVKGGNFYKIKGLCIPDAHDNNGHYLLGEAEQIAQRQRNTHDCQEVVLEDSNERMLAEDVVLCDKVTHNSLANRKNEFGNRGPCNSAARFELKNTKIQDKKRVVDPITITVLEDEPGRSNNLPGKQREDKAIVSIRPAYSDFSRKRKAVEDGAVAKRAFSKKMRQLHIEEEPILIEDLEEEDSDKSVPDLETSTEKDNIDDDQTNRNVLCDVSNEEISILEENQNENEASVESMEVSSSSLDCENSHGGALKDSSDQSEKVEDDTNQTSESVASNEKNNIEDLKDVSKEPEALKNNSDESGVVKETSVEPEVLKDTSDEPEVLKDTSDEPEILKDISDEPELLKDKSEELVKNSSQGLESSKNKMISSSENVEENITSLSEKTNEVNGTSKKTSDN